MRLERGNADNQPDSRMCVFGLCRRYSDVLRVGGQVSDEQKPTVKILRMPPRTLKEALHEIAEIYGAGMTHFMIVGIDDKHMPFCYTSDDSLYHLAAAKLTLELTIGDLVERIQEDV